MHFFSYNLYFFCDYTVHKVMWSFTQKKTHVELIYLIFVSIALLPIVMLIIYSKQIKFK